MNYNIIYKLIDGVVTRLESMLAPLIEVTVVGEAEVVQLFDISLKGKKTKQVGGCKVFNGVISLKEKCRVTRVGKIIFTGMSVYLKELTIGRLDTLRHFKDEVKEVQNGNDCGLSFEEFSDLRPGDLVQCFKETVVPRKLDH
jgi:translation initiation factor IF-2